MSLPYFTQTEPSNIRISPLYPPLLTASTIYLLPISSLNDEDYPYTNRIILPLIQSFTVLYISPCIILPFHLSMYPCNHLYVHLSIPSPSPYNGHTCNLHSLPSLIPSQHAFPHPFLLPSLILYLNFFILASLKPSSSLHPP